MKKIFVAIMALVIATMGSVDASAHLQWGKKRNVVIQYEDITQDGALRQFKHAKWETQREILISLVRSAEKSYLNCKTIEDLYDVKDNIEIIKHYIREADQKARSITVTNDLKVLDRKITQTEAEYKKAKVISKPVNIEYDLDTTDKD